MVNPRVLVVEKPLADARQECHIVRPAVGDQDVGIGTAREIADDGRNRADAARRKPRPLREIEVPLVEQDRHFVRTLVGNHEVQPAVTCEIGNRDADRVCPGEDASTVIDRRPELAVAQTGIDQYVVAPAVGDDQVRNAVAVQIRQLHRAGVQQPCGLIGQDSGARRALIHNHPVKALVRVDHIPRRHFLRDRPRPA